MTTTTRLAIAGEMTIYRATELKQTLLAALERQSAVELDLSEVSELDTAGVQLLLLAKQLAQANGTELRFVGPSATVLEVFELLDLGVFLGGTLSPLPAGEVCR